MKNQQLLLRYILPFTFGVGVFTFLVVKAAKVQITVDEAYTLSLLTKESVWDLVSYKESYTNNHVLHTLLCKLSFSIFGMDQLAGRLPVLLSFLLYFNYVWRFSRRFFTDDFVSLMFIAVMIGNPYLLDFFSLARGYGVAIGLMMTSIYFTARYIIEGYKKGLIISQVFAILSVYAQFGLLHFYLGLNFLIFIFNIQRYPKTKNKLEILRGVSVQIISAFVLGILVYLPFKGILKDNQIRYYGANNIWDDTIVSLLNHSLYGQGYFDTQTLVIFKNLMFLLFAFLFIYLFLKIRNNEKFIVKRNNKKISVNKIKIEDNKSLLISNKLIENNKKIILQNNELIIENNELLIENNKLLLIKDDSVSVNYQWSDPSVFSFGLLLATVFVIVVQFYLLGTQYVVDRTALFLYPIIALNFTTLAFLFGQKSLLARQFVAILFIIFCTWHILRSSNLVYFYDWWFDKNTLEVLKDMKTEYQKRQNGKPIKLHTHAVLQPAFDYYFQEQHLDWLVEPFGWDNQPDTVKHYDFYYDYDDELPILQSKYEVVKKYDGGEFLLLKPK